MRASQPYTALRGQFSGQSPATRYTPRPVYPDSPNVLQFTPRNRGTPDNTDDNLPRPRNYADNRNAVINRAVGSALEISRQRTPPPQQVTPPTPVAPSRIPSLSRIPPMIPFQDAGGTVPQTPSNNNESDGGSNTTHLFDSSSDSSDSIAGSIDTRRASNVADRNNMVQSLLDKYDIYRFMPIHEFNPAYFYDIYHIQPDADDLALLNSLLQSFEQRRYQMETLIGEICNFMAATPIPNDDIIPNEINLRINQLDIYLSLAQKDYVNMLG